MSYGIRFSEIASEQPIPVPLETIQQIRIGLDQLAADPDSHSRRAVSPPFPPFGHQCDIPCSDNDGNRYNAIAFFVYSDCGKYLDVHRFVVQRLGVSLSHGQTAEAHSIRAR